MKGYQGPSLAVKQMGYKTEHSLPPSAKVKTAWTYTSVSPHPFMAWCLIKNGVKFFFNLHENPTPSKSNKIKQWWLWRRKYPQCTKPDQFYVTCQLPWNQTWLKCYSYWETVQVIL